MTPTHAWGHKPHITFFQGQWIVSFVGNRQSWNHAAWDWCDKR